MRKLTLAIILCAALAQALPPAQWQEGRARIAGQVDNFDPAAGKSSAIVYPRFALGRYADAKLCATDVDSAGRFAIDVPLYQSHQPCYIDAPGLYGLIYLSPGDTVALSIDIARRWARGHQGDEGSAVYAGGADSDINNALCTNEAHHLLWQTFGNSGGLQAEYAEPADIVAAAMAHRAAHRAAIDSLSCPDRAKEALRIECDVDVAYTLMMAPMWYDWQPDTSYYSWARDFGISNPMLRWGSYYDQLVHYCLDIDMGAIGVDDPEFLQTLRLKSLARQIDQGQPLADSVFADIKTWAATAAVSFLTAQNDALKATLGLTDLSQISRDAEGAAQLLAIAEKHKDKLILIDFWNTWCKPCMAAIAEHEPHKAQFADDVSFVYIADESSPLEAWQAATANITGDHYRLPLTQSNGMMQLFGLKAYPSYLLIGRDGSILGAVYHLDINDLEPLITNH